MGRILWGTYAPTLYGGDLNCCAPLWLPPHRGRLCSCVLMHCILQILYTMSSSRNATTSTSNSSWIVTLSEIPLFKGMNYLSWWPKMETYLISTSCMWIVNIPEPAKPSTGTDHNIITGYIKRQESNGKLTGPILQTLSEALFEKYKVHTTYTNLIKAIQDDYAKPTIATIFANFKVILETSLPNLGNPEPSIQRLESLFAWMKNAAYPIPDNIQVLCLLAKILPSLDTIAQIIVQAKDSSGKAKEPTFAEIHAAVNMAWTTASLGGKGKQQEGQQVNKISTVKHKVLQDPKFQQQRQPTPVPSGQQGGGSSAQNQGPQEQRPHSKRSGKQTKKKQAQQQLQFAQAAF